jgi:hypothetical protein
MLRRWARELYAKRSEVHGSPARTDSWSHGWHAMLATVAYGICVKQLLAGAGRYTLSRDDRLEVAAFPWRVTKLRSARLPRRRCGFRLGHCSGEGVLALRSPPGHGDAAGAILSQRLRTRRSD